MLWNYMIANRYRISDVARILSMPASQVQRMVDVDKDGASVDAIEKALNAIGG
ncbi:MAG: hypothetical protein IJ164_05675 [Duodenibacillus sp.]|nr:hypothetical protein [Duodenibacillus sp.]